MLSMSPPAAASRTSPSICAPGFTSAAGMRCSVIVKVSSATPRSSTSRSPLGRKAQSVGLMPALDGVAQRTLVVLARAARPSARRPASMTPSVSSSVEPAIGEAGGAMHTASSDSLVRVSVSQSGIVDFRAAPCRNAVDEVEVGDAGQVLEADAHRRRQAVADDHRQRLGVAGKCARQVGALASSGSARWRRRSGRTAAPPRRRSAARRRSCRGRRPVTSWPSGPVKPRPERPPKRVGLAAAAAMPPRQIRPPHRAGRPRRR